MVITFSKRVLKKDFFQRDTLKVAEEILGKYLVRNTEQGVISGMITEVEAYDGPQDKASHASRGRTRRNEVMFWGGGYIYVYLVYGIHYMVNIVTGAEEYPAAILIRGTEQVSGPGRLTNYFQIDRSLDKISADPSSGLWVENRGVRIEEGDIYTTHRVGVQYAGDPWAYKPYRYILKR